MTQDQLHYQELAEQKRHDLEMEKLSQADIAQKHRATAVTESWNKEQARLRQLEQDLKERQYQTHKAEWTADYIQSSISQFLGERQNAWSRFKDAYGMAKSALFS